MAAGNEDWWKQCKAREKALDVKVKAALDDVKELAVDLTACPKVWFSHFGATGIDAKHLFVFGVLPKRADVDACRESGGWAVIQDTVFAQLQTHGYPVESLGELWINLFSQQECDEEANGNWYYFFK